jgi:hypothetical protein
VTPEWTASAYRNSAFSTYAEVDLEVSYVRDAGCLWGMTGQEGGAIRAEVAPHRNAAMRAINRHLAFMRSHPAAPCFRDAYAADRRVATTWLERIRGGSGSDQAGEGRAWNRRVNDIWRETDAFLQNLPTYFQDC